MRLGDGPGQPGVVIMQLLDGQTRRPLTSWRFASQSEITIGRSTDRDVVIESPYVSRMHAELLFVDGRWLLFSRGRNGVLLGDETMSEARISGGETFRLGPSGPYLRFQVIDEGLSNFSTLSMDSSQIERFELDRSKLAQEVGSIAEGEYFQSLIESAKELRRKRSEG